jgi:hypothetical protein
MTPSSKQLLPDVASPSNFGVYQSFSAAEIASGKESLAGPRQSSDHPGLLQLERLAVRGL